MPSAPFLVPPLLLTAILVVSAVAKLRDHDDTVSVFTKLRLPDVLLTLRAPRLLPYGELALAVLLVVLPGRWYLLATTATCALFACYLWVVARALRFPYPVRCGCFGRLGLGWVTRQTALRNVALLLLALVAWLDSWRAEGVLARFTHLGESGAWWLTGVVVAVLVTGLVVRESRLPPTPAAPALDDSEAYVARSTPYGLLEGPDGPASVWRLTDAAARLLVFWDPRKDQADEVAARLPAWQQALAPVQVHLVSGSEWASARDLRPDLADHLLGDPDGDTRARMGVHHQPGAVLLGTDRLFAGGPAEGLAEIEELVEAAAVELTAAPVEQPQ